MAGNTLMSLLLKLGVDASDFNKGIDDAQAKAGGFGKGLISTIGKGAVASAAVIAGVGAAAIGAGGAIVGMTVNAAKGADDILAMSAKYGIATDQLQKMKYSAELVDVPLETMTGSYTRLTMSMAGAKDGTGEQAKLFESLGVSVLDSAGNLRSTNDVWLETIGALGGIENQAERDAISLKLFGRSAMELNPLITAGTDKLAALGVEAQKSGYVLSTSQLDALGRVDDAMQRIGNAANGIKNQFAASFAPGIAGAVEQISGYMGKLGAIMGDSSLSASDKIAKGSELVQNIANDITSKLPELMKTGLGILKAIITGIINAIPTLIPAVVEMISSIVGFITEMLPVLVDGAVKIIVALANGLAQSLPVLIPAIVDMMMTIVTVLIDNIPLLLDAAIQLVIGLANGLIAAIPVLISKAPELISSLITALVSQMPLIVQGALQLIVGLALGLVQAIPQLVMAIPQIIIAIVRAFTSGIPSMNSAGSDLMAGFWNGLSSWFATISQKVNDFVGSVVGSVKNVLGIHSPSRIFEQIGSMSMAGLALGLSDVSPVNAAMQGITGAMTASFPAASSLGNQNSAGSSNKNISVVVNNPVGQTTNDSVNQGLQRLAFLGVA